MPQRTAEPWTTGSRTAGPQGQAVSRLDRSVMPTAECPDDSYRREGTTPVDPPGGTRATATATESSAFRESRSLDGRCSRCTEAELSGSAVRRGPRLTAGRGRLVRRVLAKCRARFAGVVWRRGRSDGAGGILGCRASRTPDEHRSLGPVNGCRSGTSATDRRAGLRCPCALSRAGARRSWSFPHGATRRRSEAGSHRRLKSWVDLVHLADVAAHRRRCAPVRGDGARGGSDRG